MSKIDVIISTLDQLTAGELKALRGEINARLDDNPYNNGYTDGFNDANEKHQKDSMRHRQPVILEAQELSINLAVIATAAAVMGQGKAKASDVMKDARNQSMSLMDSLNMRINRAKNEGITFTLHADDWIEGLLNEAKDYYEQPTNKGDRLRAYVGNLDSSLFRVIEARTENKPPDEVIDRLCARMDSYIQSGYTLAHAYKSVQEDLKRDKRKYSTSYQNLRPEIIPIEQQQALEEIEHMFGKDGKKSKSWTVDSARKDYQNRYGSAKRFKNGNLP